MNDKSKGAFIRISQEPGSFTFHSMKRIHKGAPGIINQGFYARIFRKYQRISLFIQLSLYFLHPPGESTYQSLKLFRYTFSILFKYMTYVQPGSSSSIPNPAKSFIQTGIPQTGKHPDKEPFSKSGIVNTLMPLMPIMPIFLPMQSWFSAVMQRKTDAFATYLDIHQKLGGKPSKHEDFHLMRRLQAWNSNIPFINADDLRTKGRAEIFGSRSCIISKKVFEKGFDINKGVRLFLSLLDICSPKISHPEKDISQTGLATRSRKSNTLSWRFKSISKKKTYISLGRIISKIPRISPEKGYKIVSDSIMPPHLFNDSIITYKRSWQMAMKDLLFNKGIISHSENSPLLEYHPTHIKNSDELYLYHHFRPLSEYHPTHIKNIYNKLAERNQIKTILDGFHYRISKRLKGFFSKSAHIKIILKGCHYLISKGLEGFFSRYISLEGAERDDNNINQLVFNAQGAFSTKGALAPLHIYYSDLIYLSPNRSPASSELVQKTQKEEIIEYKKDISSYETGRTAPQGMPEINMYRLTDKIYRLLFERIRREKELRGR